MEYYPSERDTAGVVKYYGFLTNVGSWIIMQDDTSAGTYRYIGGASDLATAWTGRAGLSYKLFNEMF